MLILAGMGILYISTSETMMRKISDIRNESDAWWGVHSSREKGDLVNMAYLDYIHKFHSERDYMFTKAVCKEQPQTDLYLYGDSYTFKIPDTAFACVDNYTFGWRYSDIIKYRLDTSKKNILIIETTERYLAIYFLGLDLFKQVYDSASGPKEMEEEHIVKGFKTPSLFNDIERIFHFGLKMLFNIKWNFYVENCFSETINQNIEYHLFDYNFLSAPRQAKASLNYYLFKRASGDVVISESGDQLFIKESVSEDNIMSARYHLKDDEYSIIINNLNTIYDHYRSEGFDEVYLAAIPNPVTILEPHGYNMLIPRLQSDPSLRMKCIDIYSEYKQNHENIFRPGDTHWSNKGMQMWIQVVNDSLRKHTDQ